MSESHGIYTATVIDRDGDVRTDIDVRPPFTPSEEFLRSCDDDLGTTLEHFVTTPNTTRLSVTINDESLRAEEIDVAFLATAAFIAKSLNAVDEGESVIALQPWEEYDRVEAKYQIAQPETHTSQ